MMFLNDKILLMSLFRIFTLSNAIFSNAIIKTTTTRWRNRGNTALWQVVRDFGLCAEK